MEKLDILLFFFLLFVGCGCQPLETEPYLYSATFKSSDRELKIPILAPPGKARAVYRDPTVGVKVVEILIDGQKGMPENFNAYFHIDFSTSVIHEKMHVYHLFNISFPDLSEYFPDASTSFQEEEKYWSLFSAAELAVEDRYLFQRFKINKDAKEIIVKYKIRYWDGSFSPEMMLRLARGVG